VNITNFQSLINNYIKEKQFANHREHTVLKLQIPICECCVGKYFCFQNHKELTKSAVLAKCEVCCVSPGAEC
jgi:hypothetical protein